MPNNKCTSRSGRSSKPTSRSSLPTSCLLTISLSLILKRDLLSVAAICRPLSVIPEWAKVWNEEKSTDSSKFVRTLISYLLSSYIAISFEQPPAASSASASHRISNLMFTVSLLPTMKSCSETTGPEHIPSQLWKPVMCDVSVMCQGVFIDEFLTPFLLRESSRRRPTLVRATYGARRLVRDSFIAVRTLTTHSKPDVHHVRSALHPRHRWPKRLRWWR